MNRSVRDFGGNQNFPLEGGNHLYPIHLGGNPVNPLQGGNQNFPLEGGNHLYPIQQGGNHMYPLQGGNQNFPLEGGNHLYPIHLGGYHMYPLQGGNLMIPTGFNMCPNYVIPRPPLPNFCEAPPRSSFLESTDNETEWVKWGHLSDEEMLEMLRECRSNPKGSDNVDWKAIKRAHYKDFAKYSW